MVPQTKFRLRRHFVAKSVRFYLETALFLTVLNKKHYFSLLLLQIEDYFVQQKFDWHLNNSIDDNQKQS
jgi:hypothetical protein